MLEVEQLHAYYGKSHVLQGVTLQIGAGEIVGLLGRNGVGRSTLAKAIMGDVDVTGSIRFFDKSVQGLKPHQIARLGIAYVPESRDVFATLTVRQNLELGLKSGKNAGRWTVAGMLDMFPNLAQRAEIQAGVLSGGEQQMLTMCRSLLGDPSLIMIDEPTEGLAPKVVEQIGELLRDIADKGVSILLIEQKLSIALKVCSRLYVMGHGRIVFEGTPASLQERKDISKEWLEV
ncbi:ABC transporter ATP-binding protein [Simplicispira suum]|uniref:ABC transporter ATP-binding protein n=1 Tax=Simplicispira suum TaxID=2109915 RepID=A0A2S0N338_9BURK|nr:ABC transporter ATP-binding protein [Simplicispira suum]AVO42560.1 ABC transporter ATP-binding protein [Simplicispira suum]